MVAEAMGLQRIRNHGNGILASCPMSSNHKNGDRNPSFMMFGTNEGIGHKCYGCGIGGNASLLCKNDLGMPQVSRMIDDLSGYINYDHEDGKPSVNVNVFKGGMKFSDNTNETKKNAHLATKEQMEGWMGNVPNYFISRGIPLETCRHLGMGEDLNGYEYPSLNVQNADGTPKLINMGPRGVFIVRNLKGKIVGWSGRLTYDSGDNFPPRYFHQVDRNEYLYNENNLDFTLDYAVVFEGQMGVANFTKYGVKNCVATMGANLSETQKIRLDTMFDFIIFVPDMDIAGERYAGEIRQAFGDKAIINPHHYFKCVNTQTGMDEYKDSGEFDRNEVKEYLINVKTIRDGLRP